MALYRVVMECTLIVEAGSPEGAEHKATLNPGMYDHEQNFIREAPIEVDEDGDDVEKDEAEWVTERGTR